MFWQNYDLESSYLHLLQMNLLKKLGVFTTLSILALHKVSSMDIEEYHQNPEKSTLGTFFTTCCDANNRILVTGKLTEPKEIKDLPKGAFLEYRALGALGPDKKYHAIIFVPEGKANKQSIQSLSENFWKHTHQGSKLLVLGKITNEDQALLEGPEEKPLWETLRFDQDTGITLKRIQSEEEKGSPSPKKKKK